MEPALLSDWRPRGGYSLWLDFLSDVCKLVGFQLLGGGPQFESASFPALETKGGVHGLGANSALWLEAKGEVRGLGASSALRLEAKGEVHGFGGSSALRLEAKGGVLALVGFLK